MRLWERAVAFVIDLFSGRQFDAGRDFEKRRQAAADKTAETLVQAKQASTRSFDDETLKAKVSKWTRHK